MVSSRSFSPGSARPRWATPATPGRPDLAGKVAWTASALGFRGLMAHQRQIIATGTERLADGPPAFRQGVIEGPRQQGKSVSGLSLIMTRGPDVPTAGTEFSAYFRGKVDDGRAMAELGVTDTAAYFGYSAPDDADPGDPAAWYGCMPALGITVSEETVRADFATMPLAEFRRAYLCQWPEVAKPGWDVISQQAWAASAG